MKLTVNQDMNIAEDEVIINCTYADERITRMIDYIRQLFFSLEGEMDGRTYQVPIEGVLYAESVDGRTFIYDKNEAYFVRQTLTSLEEQLEHTAFVRISQNCLMNTAKLKCVQPYINHRMLAQMENGEKLIITRNYMDGLKEKLRR